MALIKCTECGQMVSDRAKSCPSCGCPINNEVENYNNPTTSFNQSKKILFLTASIIVAVAVGAFFAGISENSTVEKEKLANTESERNEVVETQSMSENSEVKLTETQSLDGNNEVVLTPSEINQKIVIGKHLTSSDYDVMISYCEDHNIRINEIIDDIKSGSLTDMELDMQMATLHEKYRYIETFFNVLGDNRGKLTASQKQRTTKIATDFKKAYSRLKQ